MSVSAALGDINKISCPLLEARLLVDLMSQRI
jgi:hypothetical protein